MKTLISSVLILSLTCADAAITVSGVVDKGRYDNQATLSVGDPAGFTTTATLDGVPFPVGAPTVVRDMHYHELKVQEVNTSTASVSNRTVRFIISSAERLGTEHGIPPHTPWPIVNSSPGEFAHAVLKVMMPASFPLGYEMPVAVRIEDPAEAPLWLNGRVTSSRAPGQAMQARRGFGSALWPVSGAPGAQPWDFSLAGLSAESHLQVETNTVWTTVSGTLLGTTVWPANSRIHVDGTLLVGTNAVLQVQPGTLVRLGPGVDVNLHGSLHVNGTWNQPVVFMPNHSTQPWGGIWVKPGARVDATALMLTGSGEDQTWFTSNSGFSTHLRQQAAFLFDQSSSGAFTNCVITHLRGQVFNGKSAQIRFIRSQFQRASTGGELNDGTFTASQSHWSEFPDATRTFVDGDNDGLYLNGGQNNVDMCSWGWTKDDGIDSGGSNIGHMAIRDSWIEACYHEGESMSGNKTLGTTNSVVVNCGQAQEDGYQAGGGGPRPRITNCLFTENKVGLRFGDNYTSGYSYSGAFLTASNNVSIYNHFQDVWGMEFANWVYQTGQMDVRSNWFTAANAFHPQNHVWNPPTDAHRLARFRAAPGAPVGVGLMYDTPQGYLDALGGGIAIGLSSFAEFPVSVTWKVLGRAASGAPETLLASGSESFLPGQMYRSVPLSPSLANGMRFVRVALADPVGAEITHGVDSWFLATSPATDSVIAQFGSAWRYLDNNVNPGAGWQLEGYNDASWEVGNAELGYGGNDEAQTIDGGPTNGRFPTYYFRKTFSVATPSAWTNLQMVLRYDDAAAAYLNGVEVYRTSTLATNATHATFVTTTSANNATITRNLSPTLLHAGDNLVAVEVHQAGPTSSDVSFALGLTLQRAPVLTLAPLATESGGIVLHDPAGAVLEQSADLLHWETAPQQTSPLPIPAGVDRMYYRLRR